MMGLVASQSFSVSLDTKRRPTLPAALLKSVHIEPGDELVARAVGEGVIMLETLEAAQTRTLAEFRAGFGSAGTPEGSAVDRLLADRRDAATHPAEPTVAADANRSEALLRAFEV